MNQPLIVIAGPTACGKTALSVALAKRCNAMIVSADSMQIYRKMDIGTAKVTKEEMQEIPHFMIDEINPDEEMNTAAFSSMAIGYINRIHAENHPAVLVGGSGLYIDSIVFDSYSYGEEPSDMSIRRELEKIAREKGNLFLHAMLEKVDPEYAHSVHPNNVRRVVRALEFYRLTGKRKSENVHEKRFRYPKTHYFALKMQREILYERINKRVDIMVGNGLFEEVENLRKEGYTKDMQSMQAIGYREILEYLDGTYDRETAIEKIKQYSRNYAKRQYTWFRRNPEIHWMDTARMKTDEMLEYMEGIIYAHQNRLT